MSEKTTATVSSGTTSVVLTEKTMDRLAKLAGDQQEKVLGYEPIETPHKAYDLLQELREKYHQHLTDARVLLAWANNWKPDKDGHVQLSKPRLVGELDRQLIEADFIILLNRECWDSFEDPKRLALLDHELCHLAPRTTADGERAYDAEGTPLWRLRKHDVEEFHGVVERHGIWKGALEVLARTFQRHNEQLNLFEASTPGKAAA